MHSNPKTAKIRLIGLASILSLVVLSGCISDGPNQTGLEFMTDNGLTFTPKFEHIEFDRFPLELADVQVTDKPRYGDSISLLGIEGDFRAGVLVGFDVSVKSGFVDSLNKKDSATSVGIRFNIPEFDTATGKAYISKTREGRDSLKVLVRAFSLRGKENSVADSLVKFHQTLMVRQHPLTELADSLLTTDTVVISPDIKDIRTLRLPNLSRRMVSPIETGEKWMAYIECMPIPDSSKKPLMLRIQSGGPTNPFRLVVGNFLNDKIQLKELTPYSVSGQISSGVLSKTWYVGSNKIYPLETGSVLHLSINRQTLLDSLKKRGVPGYAQNLSTSQEVDFRSYVALANLTLLFDSATTKLPPFAFDAQTYSLFDSTLEENDDLAIAGIPLKSKQRVGYLTNSGGLKVTDSIFAEYSVQMGDTSSRQLVVSRSVSKDADTFYVKPGIRRELTLSRDVGGAISTLITLNATKDTAYLTMHFSHEAEAEPVSILNPITGVAYSDYKDIKTRLIKPGATGISLRMTRGLRKVMNRNSKKELNPEFQIRVLARNAIDTTGWRRLPFPVLGEIGLHRENGKPIGKLELWLHPLESK